MFYSSMSIWFLALIWTTLGGAALYLEVFGGFPCGHSERKEHAAVIRTLCYGPLGWIVLAAIHVLPRFVDSKLRI